MNDVRDAIVVGTHEESGIWDVLTDISDSGNVDRAKAFQLLKSEIDFITSSDEIYLVRSKNLYDSSSCKILDKQKLLSLELDDVEFKKEGPFYYISSVSGI